VEIDKNHIDKVFSGKFSLKDQKILENYFEDDRQNQKLKQIVLEQWDQFVPESEDQPNLDHIFYKLYYTIDQNSSTKNKHGNLYFRISQIAAILIVGLLIAGGIYFSGSRVENANLQKIEFISKTGFRNQFKLPDGTSGWLGYNSELSYQVDKNHQRVVRLNGLAFFDVTHNDEL
jgi:ferric-dicitrate binding protein FerR (iron transport regulator)